MENIMTLERNDSLMFLAYHIRSSFLVSEATFSERLEEQDLSLDKFYVLRCNWKQAGTSLIEISSHAMQTKEQTLNVINDFVSEAYVVENSESGFYSLSSKGAALRVRVMKSYQEHISKSYQGLSIETIEVALSALLTGQNNLQPSD